MKSFRILSLAIVAVTTGSSCASGPTTEVDTSAAQERVCINTNRVRGFDALHNRYLYLRESRERHFLLTMRGHCLNLRNAVSIAISDTTNRVCSRGFGKVIYRDGLGGRFETCVIDTIESVGSKEHAQKIVESRTGVPDEGGTLTELPLPESEDATDPDQ